MFSFISKTIALLTIFLFFTLVSAQNELPEDILDWEPPRDISKKFPHYLSGYDYDGAPVWVIEFGKWDLKSVTDKGGQAEIDLDKHILQMVRVWVTSGNKAEGSPGFSVISDLEGYDLSQAASIKGVQKYIFIVRTFVNNLKDGKLKSGYVINANYIFQSIWNLSKPVFGKVLDDIRLFGTNSEVWKPLLLKDIPRDQLAEWYGGAKSHKPNQVYG